jgi:hypothetical protein
MAAVVSEIVGPTQKSSSTSHNMSITATSGNTIVVFVSYFCGTVDLAITVSDGTNTYNLKTRSDPSGLDTIVTRAWVAENVTGGALTIVTSCATAFIPTISVVEVSGVDASSYDDGDYGVDTDATPITNSATATTAGLALGAMTHGGSSLTIGEGTGWTLVGENEVTSGTMPQSIISKAVAAGGVTADWTLSSLAASYMSIVILKDAAGGGGTSIPVIMNLTRQYRQ